MWDDPPLMAVVRQKDRVVKGPWRSPCCCLCCCPCCCRGAPAAASADLGDEGGVLLQWQLWPLNGIDGTAGVDLATAEQGRGSQDRTQRTV